MSNPQKRKGDRAELGVQSLIRDLLGWPARRKLGAGRQDDMGDLDGLPDTVAQVCDWKDAMAALREKPRECEIQQARAGATFGATFLRLRGGEFRVILTPAQWATYARESQADAPLVYGTYNILKCGLCGDDYEAGHICTEAAA